MLDTIWAFLTQSSPVSDVSPSHHPRESAKLEVEALEDRLFLSTGLAVPEARHAKPRHAHIRPRHPRPHGPRHKHRHVFAQAPQLEPAVVSDASPAPAEAAPAPVVSDSQTSSVFINQAADRMEFQITPTGHLQYRINHLIENPTEGPWTPVDPSVPARQFMSVKAVTGWDNEKTPFVDETKVVVYASTDTVNSVNRTLRQYVYDPVDKRWLINRGVKEDVRAFDVVMDRGTSLYAGRAQVFVVDHNYHLNYAEFSYADQLRGWTPLGNKELNAVAAHTSEYRTVVDGAQKIEYAVHVFGIDANDRTVWYHNMTQTADDWKNLSGPSEQIFAGERYTNIGEVCIWSRHGGQWVHNIRNRDGTWLGWEPGLHF